MWRLLVLFLMAAPALAQDGVGDEPGPRQVAMPVDHSAEGERIVAGLSHDSVAITASFDGSEILIYGAIGRDAPAPEGPLDVIVTVEAPSDQVTIRKKERRLGIWVNTQSVRVGAAPSLYTVATTRPLRQILTPAADTRWRISIPLALRAFAGPQDVERVATFTEAMVQTRIAEGLYRLDEGSVRLVDDTLFRADVRLPANLVEGEYKTRIFLLRGGEVIASHRAAIEVRKVGLERWLYRMSLDQPLLYGLLSLAIAIAAGWAASAAFRVIRPQ
ncbi:MAG: TIGR02186 family protein [Paracoccus sp. (in: a-proteobacteria)]|uniref:TIGR02186 family protein n=1 Tax=Paracoccus sp. TaxID=267 RepID=UPI0026E0D416|nr:TIGR02186 family protein [Paracoccus sp. (in: a-proteobacteria)]MDO5620561.1 TIGR02186 family protein [Paracoccus sp. (in: a-proteobacteria)]